MRLLTDSGFSLPLWFKDFLGYQGIATTAYDPIATYQASAKTTTNEATLNVAIKGGFAVKNATENAGVIYAVTLTQFEDYLALNKGITKANWSLTGITPRAIYLAAGEWALTPLVKVYAGNHGAYPSTVVTINVARIL